MTKMGRPQGYVDIDEVMKLADTGLSISAAGSMVGLSQNALSRRLRADGLIEEYKMRAVRARSSARIQRRTYCRCPYCNGRGLL